MILGIDIAKAKFDVTLVTGEGRKRHRTFANQANGFAQLSAWLAAQQATVVHACLEATNIYWEALAEYLHAQGHQVSVVNPVRIAGYAKSQLRRNKTDKLDSEVIADFCATQQPSLWTPPTTEQKTLRSLERHRQALLKTRTQQTNRRSTCTEPLVQKSLDTLIGTLDSELAQVEANIAELVKQQSELCEQLALLTSITSIGEKTAIKLMAELYDLAEYPNANALDADAGLSPARHDSGHSVHRKPKLCKVGKPAVRGALYLPALNAMRHNPIVRNLAQRLRAKGKSEMVIIGAAMRKLLHLVYGVSKHKTPFDPNWGRSTPVPA
jgi:transposase